MECETPASVVSNARSESSSGSSADGDGDDDALDGRVDGPPEEAAAAAAAAAAIDDAGDDDGEDAEEDEPEAGAGDEPTKPKKLAISKLTTTTGDGSAPCVALDLVTSGNSKSLRIIALSACYRAGGAMDGGAAEEGVAGREMQASDDVRRKSTKYYVRR